MMNPTTFKRVLVALYLAYSIATDTIIWGGAVYYFFFQQEIFAMDNFRIFLEVVRTITPMFILALQILILNGL